MNDPDNSRPTQVDLKVALLVIAALGTGTFGIGRASSGTELPSSEDVRALSVSMAELTTELGGLRELWGHRIDGLEGDLSDLKADLKTHTLRTEHVDHEKSHAHRRRR